MKLTVSLLLILAALALVWGKRPRPADKEKTIRVQTVVNWICKLLNKLEIRNTKSLCERGKGRNPNHQHQRGGSMRILPPGTDSSSFRDNFHTPETPERPSGSLFHTRPPPVVWNPYSAATRPTASPYWFGSTHRPGHPTPSPTLTGESKEALDNLEWAYQADHQGGCHGLQQHLFDPRLKAAVRVAINVYLAKHCHPPPPPPPPQPPHPPHTPIPAPSPVPEPEPEPIKPVPVSVPEPANQTTTAPIKNPEGTEDHSSVCGVSPKLKRKTKAFRIVGGKETGSCDVVPWQVRIDSDMGMCGGSIISDRHVLTAAHCVYLLQHPGSITVVTGDYDKDKPDSTEREHRVKTMTFHQEFNISSYRNDVALLTLYEPLDFSRRCVSKVCRDPSFLPSNMFCTVSGWGATSAGGHVSDTVQMVQVLTFRGSECREQFNIPAHHRDYLSQKDKQICAGTVGGGKDSCQGDSGGPLVCMHPDTKTFVQVGVVSYGINCAVKGFPGVYSSVASFNQWIEAAMAQNP